MVRQVSWKEIYWRNGLYVVAILIFLALSLTAGYALGQRSASVQDQEAQAEPEPVAQAPAPVEDGELVILATGDIMMHDVQIRAGWDSQSQTYDFASMFREISPLLQEGDLVIGNLEVPLAGAQARYSGYPMFNAPEILATNLKQAGFDVLNTANNHALDKGFNGIISTLNFLDQAGLHHTGTARTIEEKETPLIITVKGVPIGFIGATYGTNGLVLPKDKPYGVNSLNLEEMILEVEQVRHTGARLVIAMLHWGSEYAAAPNREQEEMAQALFEAGVDIILGHHPHVLQRTDLITAEAPFGASGKADKRLVAYSLGNFVSSQKGLERLSSMVLKIQVGIDGETQDPFIKEAGYIPIFTRKLDPKGNYDFAVWPIERALENHQSQESLFHPKEGDLLPKAWKYVTDSQPGMLPVPISGR